MSKKYHFATPCGGICDPCSFFRESKCKGCLEHEGDLFWGKCEIYKCITEKSVEHCGFCSEFPCERLITQYDPNIPNGKQEAIFRIGQLSIRKRIGTEEWLKRKANGTLVSFEE
ncbi:MAG: DUF3795 domain-containing protein [Candidatus Thorarchaeota archaeon]